MGENVLDPLKAKLIGTKGTFEELLTKVQFEEARMKERMKSGCRKTPTESTDQHSSSKTPLINPDLRGGVSIVVVPHILPVIPH